MKKNQLIKALQKIEGNPEVVIDSGMNEDGHVARVRRVKRDHAKKHHDTYLFLTRWLAHGGYAGQKAFVEPYQSQIEKEPNINIIHIS